MTKVTIVPQTDYSLVQRAALFTVGKKPVNKPTDEWLTNMMLAKHSPIRCRMYWIELHDIPYYVAMHFRTHKHGVEWFCRTSRESRTGVPRDERKQTDLVNLACFINAEAIMNISAKRMCGQADVETRKVWYAVKKEMLAVDPVMASFMVPQCHQQGNECHELRSCGLCPRKDIINNNKNNNQQ